jgi:hypothetical protein
MSRWTDDDDAIDSDDGEDEPTVPCPNCRREMHADSPRCPYCGNYVSREDAPPRRKPWWIIIGGLAVLYIVYRWVVG